MKESELEIILQDFDKEKDMDSRSLENGITWFWGEGGSSCMYHGGGETCKSIGHPEDYLGIRDDYKNLKEFLGKLLDKGRLYYGTPRWDQDGETNCADYAIWLYRHCKYDSFKRNFEKATIELLISEFKKEFKPFDYQTALKIATEKYGYLNYFLLDEEISTYRWRYGIGDPDDENEGWFRNWFDEEVSKTSKKEGEFEKTNFSQVSPGLREALKKRHFHQEAYCIALKEYMPQLNRLVGLLDIIIILGNPNNGFAALYEQSKKDGEPPLGHYYSFLRDSKILKYHFIKVNLNEHIPGALNRIGYLDKYNAEFIRGKISG